MEYFEAWMDALIDVDAAYAYLSNYIAVIFLVEALLLLWIGKKIKDFTTSYDVDKQLAQSDNKAMAVSYTGYLIGQAIIVLAVMSGPSVDWVEGVIGVAIWSLVGILMLNLARVVNNRFLLRHFCNVREIIEDKNIGVGAVEAGSYIGTSLLLAAVVSGEQPDWIADIIGAVLFFVVGQLGFVLFGWIYGKVTNYDLHKEMERDNHAAGVSLGLTLIAVGVIVSKTVQYTVSLPAFAAWYITGIFLILISRYLVDRLILPGHELDLEIAADQNWGVALVEGGTAIMIAFLLDASFS